MSSKATHSTAYSSPSSVHAPHHQPMRTKARQAAIALTTMWKKANVKMNTSTWGQAGLRELALPGKWWQ